MKKQLSLLLSSVVLSVTALWAQPRVVAECTVTYSINVDESVADKDVKESLSKTTKTVYIKGTNSRTELISPSFNQSVIYQKSTGTAVILREFGANKFMTKLDQQKWLTENSKYEGATFAKTDESKTILGYECLKGILTLKDGSQLSLYYATNIVPSVREFEYQFKDVPGFVMAYESAESDGKKISYIATQINLSPVAASRFDIPTNGYRLLN